MCFNSRLREEATGGVCDDVRGDDVSTHASVRRRLPGKDGEDGEDGVSTHASVRRRRRSCSRICMWWRFQLTPP